MAAVFGWVLFGFATVLCTSVAYGCGAAAGGAGAAAGAAGAAGAASHAGNAFGHLVAPPIVGIGKCLHNEANVRMADGSMKKVKHLEIGDEVLAYSREKGVHPSPVYGELHNDNVTMVKLVEIETSTGRTIPVTPVHSVFVRQCLSDGQEWRAKAAYEVRVGECVPRYYPDGEIVEEAVVNIRVRDARGIRQPVTETGTIIVDDVVVSCYDRVVNQDATHFALAPYRWLQSLTQTYTQHAKSVVPSVLTWVGFDMSLM